jgi:uncharacterized membrane protein
MFKIFSKKKQYLKQNHSILVKVPKILSDLRMSNNGDVHTAKKYFLFLSVTCIVIVQMFDFIKVSLGIVFHIKFTQKVPL